MLNVHERPRLGPVWNMLYVTRHTTRTHGQTGSHTFSCYSMLNKLIIINAATKYKLPLLSEFFHQAELDGDQRVAEKISWLRHWSVRLMKSASVRPRFHSSLLWFTLKSERSGRRGVGDGGGGCRAITQLAFDLCPKILAQTGLMTSLHSPLAKIWQKVRAPVLFFYPERCLKSNHSLPWAGIVWQLRSYTLC